MLQHVQSTLRHLRYSICITSQVVVLTHCYGQRSGVRFLTNGLKVSLQLSVGLTEPDFAAMTPC